MKNILATALMLMLTACAAHKNIDPVEKSAEELYLDAKTKLDKAEYAKAATGFDEVERQHPYSEWAVKAQIMSAYSQYQNLKYDDAILALNRFIELHPGNDSVDYAYYLKALCYYEQISDVRRDQEMTTLALDALNDIIKKFPTTEYAKDAQIKIDLTMDHLAGKEMEIGRFYLKQQNYGAAINRFKTVIKTYQTTSHTPEALHRLVECYVALGVHNEAVKVAAVLGHNFPGSKWYQYSYKLLKKEGYDVEATDQETKSWVSKNIGELF